MVVLLRGLVVVRHREVCLRARMCLRDDGTDLDDVDRDILELFRDDLPLVELVARHLAGHVDDEDLAATGFGDDGHAVDVLQRHQRGFVSPPDGVGVHGAHLSHRDPGEAVRDGPRRTVCSVLLGQVADDIRPPGRVDGTLPAG
jgi:hypothetical protein